MQRDALEEAQCFDIFISSLKEMDVLSLLLQLLWLGRCRAMCFVRAFLLAVYIHPDLNKNAELL